MYPIKFPTYIFYENESIAKVYNGSRFGEPANRFFVLRR